MKRQDDVMHRELLKSKMGELMGQKKGFVDAGGGSCRLFRT
jgi:hypothetical protein